MSPFITVSLLPGCDGATIADEGGGRNKKARRWAGLFYAMEQDELITPEEWRHLVRKAGVKFVQATEGLEGST